MKASTKRLLNFAFLFATLGVVLYIGLSGGELQGAWQALQSITPFWLLICFLCWAAYMLLDTLSIYSNLKAQDYDISFRYTLYVAIMGIYYCNVTPGATGGQPMQVYYLKKKNIPIGIATSTLTVKYFCFQLMLMVLGTIAWIVFRDYVHEQVGQGNMWILIFGYVFNMISVGFVLLMAVSRRLVRFFIFIFIKVGTWLHICKDPVASTARWEANLNTFHASIMRLQPKQMLIQLSIATVQVLAYMCVTVAIYFAFSLTGTSTAQLITMSLMLYISASYTPLPGASGAQEGGFAIYFSSIFNDSTLFVALLIWRFFTFYLTLLAGALISIVQTITKKKERK